jgi:type II secretory ATPase GspE/PulE/Tfp pilus assembly ATPase PilB-like protein
MTVDRSLSKFINSNYAQRHTVVPVAVAGQMLTVCMDDPTQRTVIEDLNRSTEKVVTVVTASHESIRRALIRMYDDRVETRTAETLEVLSEERSAPSESKYAIQSAQTKVDGLVRQLISIAISRRASDVHIETLSDRLQIRLRVDGVLEYLEPGELHESCNRSARSDLEAEDPRQARYRRTPAAPGRQLSRQVERKASCAASTCASR